MDCKSVTEIKYHAKNFPNAPRIMYITLLVEENETYKHIEQQFYLLTKTWKYGGSVFGTEVSVETQAE